MTPASSKYNSECFHGTQVGLRLSPVKSSLAASAIDHQNDLSNPINTKYLLLILKTTPHSPIQPTSFDIPVYEVLISLRFLIQ